ncbi:hypothetical protein [Cruoricaptor ignavus]|nr:hypothetical protein [Cruoricaptor ignavus]
MSYCRFQNTLQDLRDCQDAIENEGIASLSVDEKNAYQRMLEVMQEMLNFDEECYIEEMEERLHNFLSRFPEDAESWADANDEIQDLSRIVRELRYDDSIEPLNFRDFKTPSEWNTTARNFIIHHYYRLDTERREIVDRIVSAK